MDSPGQAKINGIGLRQQQLLTMLLRDKAGLTVEDLSQGLGITANAVAATIPTHIRSVVISQFLRRSPRLGIMKLSPLAVNEPSESLVLAIPGMTVER